MDNYKLIKITVSILSVALICFGIYRICYLYTKLSEPPKEHCVYEIKYLHVSGREITKRVTATCEGFYRWFEDPQRYKVPTMVIPFSGGNKVLIQGATDILSVAKINDDEQQQ